MVVLLQQENYSNTTIINKILWHNYDKSWFTVSKEKEKNVRGGIEKHSWRGKEEEEEMKRHHQSWLQHRSR